MTGRGALSAHGRALLGDAAAAPPLRPPAPSPPSAADPPPHAPAEPAAAAALAPPPVLAPLLPEPLDHVLLQADLTAVAPGPLERPLADTLGRARGRGVQGRRDGLPLHARLGAPRAGRRAQPPSDLHAFLADALAARRCRSRSRYLIDDVARRHGHLRIGAASAYVRCDDDAVLDEILADKRSAGLRLRRLAPTVLAAQADPATLLEGLRAMGYAPAAESAEGDVLITRADAHRTPPRTAPEPGPGRPAGARTPRCSARP